MSVPATAADCFWQTIDTPRTDDDLISAVADELLTADGRAGRIRELLDAGGWPILLTHWQSLFSMGLETGLAALDEVGRRVSEHLSGEVEWLSVMEVARRAAGAE